ncbi:hypothetical protein T9A_01661 [Alcanivorax jadensis T9]|uniref:VanZ-like domain-containing protein n=2 Tax=Alcanivorax jadensis TaxID=64988 RepID=A0ABR4WCN2_9GAMM|nr:hypothetical protein T9A_01661 [Alcanivorax jadensis T9]MBP20858.1 VanZ family protein [Alcanivorax sp.]|tara:strand:+ start:946 stop:1284 length:339 start_codon:yes stop_codon:yes gene_type:complete
MGVTVMLFLIGGLLPGGAKEAIRQSLSAGNLDSYAHVGFCAVAGFFAILSGFRWWLVVLLIMGLGAFIEVAQVWLPGRSPSWSDIVDNGLGLGFGMLLAWPFCRCRKKDENG